MENVSRNFYISDTHFGHDNIRKLNNRPFKSVEEMDRVLIENWNNAVTERDVVYILGDFSYKSAKPVKEYLDRLNGRKVLILGNHDNEIRNNLVNGKFPGIMQVTEYLEIYETVDGEQKKLVLSHYPFVEWNGYFNGAIHLYGHIHNTTRNKAYQIMKDVPNAYNVGVDVLGFAPRTLQGVIGQNIRFNREYERS